MQIKNFKTELDKHFTIPLEKETDQYDPNMEVLTFFLMVNGKPKYIEIRVIAHLSGYIVSSLSGDLPVQTQVSYVNTTRLYKTIRDHMLGLLRRSDMKATLDRFYGVLSARFIAKSVDELLVNILKISGTEEGFKLSYKRISDTMIKELSSKTIEIMQCIRNDYLKENDKNILSNMAFKELISTRLGMDTDIDPTSIRVLSYEKDLYHNSIDIKINGGKICSTIDLTRSEYAENVQHRICDLISLYRNDTTTIVFIDSNDLLSVVYFKYNDGSSALVFRVGDNYDKVLLDNDYRKDWNVIPKIMDTLNNLNYLDRYKKKSIKNLWGVL